MNVAELFVNLGIKGGEKTVGTLATVKKGLGEVGEMSLEAKAAIVGMLYGLERMMAISGQTGTALTNFSALTGKSAQDLQKWQFAARQAGVGADELTGSVKAVQNSMTNMLLGKGAPEGIALLSKFTGGLDPTKYRDTFYMMTKLQEGIQKMTPEMGAVVGKSFGLSEGVIAAMHRNVFTPQMLAKAPTYSDKEISSLDKANVAWANLGNKIEMAFGHFNAKHGLTLVNDISKITTEIFKLADSLTSLAEKLGAFQAVADVFTGLDKFLKLLNGESLEAIEKQDKKKHRFGKGTWWMNGIEAGEDWVLDQVEKQKELGGVSNRWKELQKNAATPRVSGGSSSTTVNNTTEINQNITHHGDAKDTKAVKDTHKSAITNAYRQRSAQRQAN